MVTNDKGLQIIKDSEGLELEAYIDPVGIPTIGYGTTRIDGKKIKPGMRITRQQAEQYLKEDIEYAEIEVSKLVKVPLNENQFSALVSFLYNVGVGNFVGSTLLKKLNQGDYQRAADEFLKWVYGNIKGEMKVLPGLKIRRMKERELFLKPVEKIELDETEEIEIRPAEKIPWYKRFWK